MQMDCLLLAGGSSSRMGEPKLLLEVGGRTLFEHVLRAHLESSLRNICAVVPGWLDGFGGVMERMLGSRVDFVSLAGEGDMSTSLREGWRHATAAWGPDALMISLADKPLVTPGLIDELIGVYAASGSRICVPVFEGERGHPVILSAEFEKDICGLRGDRGARDIIEGHGEDVVEVQVDSDAVLLDVDTPGDLLELKRRLDQVG